MTLPVGGLRRALLAHLNDPWAMEPSRLHSMVSMAIDADEAGAELQLAEAAEAAAAADDGQGDGPGVAVIGLRGVITPRPSFMAMLFGGSGGGLMGFRRQLALAVSSSDVSAIVLDIDSPGGLLSLLPETAADIRQARDAKPVTAVCNTLCASAAYWLASQANDVVITPSGMAGSIGVLLMHVDRSILAEQLGVTTSVISAGRYKAEDHPYKPLSDEARAMLQTRVDDGYDLFVADVAAGRKARESDVRGGYGEGRVLSAQAAVAAGLVDRVETLEQTTRALRDRAQTRSRTRALRAELDDLTASLNPTKED